jgi:hypothetical protein
MREKTKVQGRPLSRGIHLGHPCDGDVEPQVVCVGFEAKVRGRDHSLHGLVYAAREIDRVNWKVPDLVGVVLTKIGHARHAGREQARQAHDSKTFHRHISMEPVLCLSRCEKNNLETLATALRLIASKASRMERHRLRFYFPFGRRPFFSWVARPGYIRPLV